MLNNLLLISNRNDTNARRLETYFRGKGCGVEIQHDIGEAIPRVQEMRFDVIVAEANLKGMKVEKMIRILKGLDPKVKIIIRSGSNSRFLESRIRQEKVYYYHLDSFGIEELEMAVANALAKGIANFKTQHKENYNMKSEAKILLVDDDPDFVEINRTVLENANYQVKAAYDPDEAWKTVENWNPDLIVLDVMMPTGTEGFHFAYKLRNHEKFGKIPVLMLTSINQHKDLKFTPDTDGDFLPVEEFIEKPVSATELINHVDSLLKKSSEAPWKKVDVYKGIGMK